MTDRTFTPDAVQRAADLNSAIASTMPERTEENVRNFRQMNDVFKRIRTRALLPRLSARCSDLTTIIVVNAWGARRNPRVAMSIVQAIIVRRPLTKGLSHALIIFQGTPHTRKHFRYICEDDTLSMALSLPLQQLWRVLIGRADAETWVEQTLGRISEDAYCLEFAMKSPVLWRGFEDIIPMLDPVRHPSCFLRIANIFTDHRRPILSPSC